MTIEKIDGKLNAKIFNKFKKELCKSIDDKKKSIVYNENQINTNKLNLLNLIRRVEQIKFEIENLKIYSSNINKHIKDEIEEIKTLPFIQDIKVTSTSIEIDVGKINILFRDKEIYIGDFIIYINPSGITIKCKNPILEYANNVHSFLYHPHISNSGNICYGEERGTKIEEYFAKFELKKLVYFIYLFLKSYNQNDKYYSISYWTSDNLKRINK